MKHPKILIVGGGIAGLAASAWLQRAGFTTRLVEKAERLRSDGSGILLGVNAVSLLARLGLSERLTARGQVVDRVVLADRRGRPLNTLDVQAVRERRGIGTVVVLREELHQALLSLSDPATIHTGVTPCRLEHGDGTYHVGFSDGTDQDYDLIVGADGIHSFVRQALFGSVPIRPANQEVWRFVVRPKHVAAPREAIERWGRGKRLGIFPVGDGRVYCFAVRSSGEGVTGRHLRGPDLASQFGEFSDATAQAVLAALDDDTPLLYGELGDLGDTPLVTGRAVLIGDAGHATTPNMGQGAALAIEDAWTLTDILSGSPDVATALKRFERRRLSRVRQFRDRAFRLGQLGHWSRSPWVQLRDLLLRLTPDGAAGRSVIRTLLAYDGGEPNETDHRSDAPHVHPNANP